MQPSPGRGRAPAEGPLAEDQDIGGRQPHHVSQAEAEAERARARLESHEWLASQMAEQQERLLQAEAELAGMRAQLHSLQTRRAVRYADRAWRAASKFGRLARSTSREKARRNGPGVHPRVASIIEPSSRFSEDQRYPTWVAAYDTVDDGARSAVRARLDAIADPPLVSVILPVFNPPEGFLRAALDSVRAQIYENWELCVVDDCSTAAWVPKVLAEYAAEDSRIRVERRSENGHISAASNTALAMADGEWIANFDHDDVMAEHALAVAVLALHDHPGAGLLYSDEDHIDPDGARSAPYFKPDFDPVLLLGQNYFAHLCMLRRDLVVRAGGYRLGYEGSQDWDLVLRVAELVEADQVVHVPHVLYHWRVHPGSTASSLSAKPYAALAARRAVGDHLERTGSRGTASLIGGTGFNRIRWELPDPPPAVSVVVVPRNASRVARCLDSIKVRSTYGEIELVVVDDGAFRPPLRQFLYEREGGLTVVRVDRDCSDPALRNAGAKAAGGDVLCFVDDDVEVLTDRWLEEMVGLLLQPTIGAVGAKLLYPDGTVQHSGIVAGIGGTVGHVHRFIDRLEPGYFGRALLSQCYSAVSSACMVVRREAFDAVGGFDEVHLPSLFADVDLCLRLGEAGWRIGWTPHAELLHHERKGDARPTEGENAVRFARDIRYLQSRWAHVLDRDPAYSPNLSLAHETASLAWPPRASWY